MADDTTKKTTEGTEELADATKKQADALKQVTQSARPATRALNSWNMETDAAIGNQERLADIIRQETEAIKAQVREMGSLNMQIRDVSGSVQGFMGNLKRQMTVSHQYNRLLKQMREGQKDYTASIQLSSSELGKASAQGQKHIDALNDAYIEARMRAAEYGIEAQELEAHTRELHGAFGSQLQAMGDVGAGLNRLQKSTFAFSRFMGVDYSEAVRHIDDRLMHSTKTLEEVRKETLMVAKSADTYSNNLKKLGKRALQTGNITKQGFLKIIQEIGAEFKGGKFAAEEFAKSTELFLVAGKKHGLTPAEAKQMASGFGKVISQMGQAQSIFGINTAQMFGSMLSDIGKIQDENLRKRLGYYAKRQEEQGALNILDLRGIAAAVRGSKEGTAMLLQTIEKFNLPENTLRAVVGEVMGPEQQHLTDLMVEQMRSGELRKKFEAESLQKTAEGKKVAEQQAKVWEKDLYTMVKEGATATDQRYKLIRSIEEFKGKMMEWLNKYWIFIAAAQSAQTISSLFSRGGMLSGLLGKKGTEVAGAAGAAGKLGFAAKGLGVAAAGYGGYQYGKFLEKSLGESIAAGKAEHDLGLFSIKRREGVEGEDATRIAAAMGKDKTFSNYLALKLEDTNLLASKTMKEGWEDFRENVVRIRGAVTEAHKQTYKQRQKQIEDSKKNWKKLSKSQKELIRKSEQQNKQLKRFIEKGTMSEAEKKKSDLEHAKVQKETLLDMAKKIQKEETAKDFTKAGFSRYIEDLVVSTGNVFLRKGNVGEAVNALMKSKEGARLIEKSGKSEEEVRSMLFKAILKRKVMGSEYKATELQTKTERMEEAQRIYKAGAKLVDPAMVRTHAAMAEEMRQKSTEQALKLDIGTIDTGGASKEIIAKVGTDNSIEATFPATKLKIRGKDQVKVHNNHEALNRAKKPPVG